MDYQKIQNILKERKKKNNKRNQTKQLVQFGVLIKDIYKSNVQQEYNCGLHRKKITINVDIDKTYKTNRDLNYTIQNVDSASINRMCKFFRHQIACDLRREVCFSY